MIKKILLVALMLHFLNAAQAQNTNISTGFIFDGEPFLAANPNNPQHLVVAWMGFVPLQNVCIKTKVSFNGGVSWSNTVVIPHTHSSFTSADPSLAFDNAGNVFVAYIDFNKSNDTGLVYIRKSTNGGISWGNPVQAIHTDDDPGKMPVDRPWMVIDRSGGTYDGNIYITSMNPEIFGQIPPPYHPYFTRSTDGGNSFHALRYLDTTNWLSGSQILQAMPTPDVAANGTFYAIYPSYVALQNPLPQFILARSTNGGASFTHNSVYASAVTFNDPLAKKGYLLRCNPANTQHVAFFFLSTLHGDADVFMLESTNGGNTWQAPKRINDDQIGNDRMQDLVWADFNTSGHLAVAWRDRRNAPASTYTTSSEIWAAVRHKDSVNFSPNFTISDAAPAYDTVLSGSGNDFMSLQFVHDTLHAVWGDVRTGKLNIWYQRLDVKGKLLSKELLSSEDVPQVKIFPNPTAENVFIQAHALQHITIYDASGKILYSQPASENSFTFSLQGLPKGLLFFSFTTETGTTSRRILHE